MHTSSLLCYLTLVALVKSWQPWPAHWLDDGASPLDGQIPLLTQQCKISNLTAFEMVKGRQMVDFTTNAMESFEAPKVTPLNSTAGEQWEFDGVSEDGMQSFVFGFYRDANYAILGTGNFRLSIEFAFADRTRFYEVYYPSRSVVEHCSVGTRGEWVDEAEGYSFSFQVNADMSEAVVFLDSPTVKGSVIIKSRARPLTADGHVWPAQNASTEGVPFYHWSEPIPAGDVDVDVVIKDKPLVFRGMGGHERFWSAFSWFTCLTHLSAVRVMLGPYILTSFSFTSNINPGEMRQSVVLFKDGLPVFRSTLTEASEVDDYALVTKTYGGAITGTLKDKVTGYQLELVSPGKMQHYTFFVEHANLGFEYILGEGVGGSGFSGTTCYGGAEVAEVLEAVDQIKKNEPDSWERAWRIQAERAEKLAADALKSGDRDAARAGYLRASNYTRASGYMYVSQAELSGGHLVQDARALPISEKVGELFQKAIPLMDGSVHILSIPYEEHALPGYLYLPPPSRRIPGRKIPILVNSGGADSCQEELFYLNPAAGPGMGYAVVTFDGPGQGIMLRKYGLEMRPDWEIVTGRVIDYLELYAAENPQLELDLHCIAVSGASMGGYYALRAAADPRVKACVSIDPFYDMWDFGTAHVSPLFIRAWTSGWISGGFVDCLMALLSRVSFQLRWEISITGTFFGLSSPSEILLHMKKYTLCSEQEDNDKSFLSRVTCPVLLSGAGNSLYLDVNNHTRRCYDALTNVAERNKQLWIPESEGQGSLQAKMGAFRLCNQRTYRFLDECFDNRENALAPNDDGETNLPSNERQKPPAPAKANRGWLFWAIFVCLAVTAFLSSLEGSVVSTALPSISRALHAEENYLWVVNVYFLTSAAVQPLYAQLADLFGRRWPMISAVAIFTLGSGICGGASSTNMLIGGRTVQGIGAAGINMLVELILCDLLPLKERGQFMGLLFVFIVLGSVLGPVIGGVMVQHVSWRWTFYINLPLGGTCLILLYLVLRVQHPASPPVLKQLKQIDYLGNIILAASASSVLYALTYGGTRYEWSHPSIIITLALGLCGQCLFFLYEASPFCVQPVMPLELFKNRTSAAGFMATFLQTLVSFWAAYFLPLYFQSTLLSSPSRSGVQLLPFSIVYSVGALVGGSLATRLGRFRILHIIGFVLMTVGMGCFTMFDRDTPTAVWVILIIIYGLGLGVVMACLLTGIQAALPDHLNAASTGTFAFVRSMGTIWGVSIPAAIFNNQFDQLLPNLADEKAQGALARGRAYEQASRALVDSFREPIRSEIIGLYEQSLRRVWQIGIVFAGLGLLVVLLEKDLRLRTVHESDFGLADGQEEKREN
ncbi:hypothetical protein CNMCM7691_001817 [Aspergillus felis]|uniref:Major facilitator superfamily (MFS) profile domain-containing protein n=1 Tax=Aspergillus felis TaxID=1287682 RepID=A0A8H6V997_9EURO|nr:hypothetical protein CNMCM7691_001817 [Aspergillus felis]